MLNVGIVGYTNREKFIEALSHLEGFRLIGLYDARFIIENQLADFPVEIYSSIQKLASNCDALVFANGEETNLPLIEYALKIGKSVFLENTIQYPANELVRLAKLSREAKEIIQIYHPFAFHQGIEYCYQQTALRHCIEFTYFGIETNKLMQAVRDEIRIALLLRNAPLKKISVHAYSVSMGLPDTLTLKMEFSNNSVCNLTISETCIKKEHQLRIFLNEKIIQLDLLSNTLFVKDVSENHVVHLEHQNNNHNTLLKIQLKEFLKHVLENSNPLYSIDNEMIVNEVMDKIQEKLKRNFCLI